MMSILSTETASHMTVSDVVEATRTNIDTGLNQSEVTQRRSYHGFNEFEISKEEPLWKKYLGEVCVKDKIYYCFSGQQNHFPLIHIFLALGIFMIKVCQNDLFKTEFNMVFSLPRQRLSELLGLHGIRLSC